MSKAKKVVLDQLPDLLRRLPNPQLQRCIEMCGAIGKILPVFASMLSVEAAERAAGRQSKSTSK